ncbi:vacuolar ATP synthase subunit F [Histoplasma capsulatum var. duboisii H88]|uniref:V-type proton ATPase subunit F n=2 Tax=Ajellomyces capsulatus TaxID=5037 RepID=F0U6R1_AJEC8|nr:vacuolar ATP synthase subunit F [Histoplasma capsulatum H143]EGC41490.1 vacuolar ATP synthase subunit F [Histoplasma capsulatum var. duboisii H88]
MAAPAGTYKDRQFLAVIGDEDSVTGLLLAGIGDKKLTVTKIKTQHVTDPPDSQRNFLVVDAKTETSVIEKAFHNFTEIAERIRNSVDSFTDAFPAVLEIPSKDHPYDPDKDSVLRRVRRLFGE